MPPNSNTSLFIGCQWQIDLNIHFALGICRKPAGMLCATLWSPQGMQPPIRFFRIKQKMQLALCGRSLYHFRTRLRSQNIAAASLFALSLNSAVVVVYFAGFECTLEQTVYQINRENRTRRTPKIISELVDGNWHSRLISILTTEPAVYDRILM